MHVKNCFNQLTLCCQFHDLLKLFGDNEVSVIGKRLPVNISIEPGTGYL